MKANKQTASNNVFQTIVRKVVREELVDTEDRLTKKLDYRIDQRFAEFEEKIDEKLNKFRNEIMIGIDKITGMFKKHNDEHEILNGDHKRLVAIEEKVEILEKIHPQGQHATV